MLTLDTPIPDDVILGVTHLRIGDELVPLYKCPFCNFRNIHEEEITRHARWKDDNVHNNVDVDKIDTKTYIVTKAKKESRYHYERKEDLPDSMWPWIKCLWCGYRDKLPRDLEWHFLDYHKAQLYRISPDYFRTVLIEYVLCEALRMAKQQSGSS